MKPYNVYGWTKVASEFFVKLVNNHVIVRTRFFDKKTLKYKYSAKDIYTSQIEVNTLVKYHSIRNTSKVEMLVDLQKTLESSGVNKPIKGK